MPNKPFETLSRFRRTKPKTRIQKAAKSAAALRDERNLNLAKARKKRKKNLAIAKKASKG